MIGKQLIAIIDTDIARWLAYTFIETDRASWSNFREVGLYQVTAEAIKAANQYQLIGETDIWGTDEALWKILRSANHPEVRRWVDLITPGTCFTWNEDQPLFRLSSKVRSIDPPVTDGTSLTPLSTLDPAFARFRDEYLATKRGQWPMGIVNAPAASA